jgi:hypothetical protein
MNPTVRSFAPDMLWDRRGNISPVGRNDKYSQCWFAAEPPEVSDRPLPRNVFLSQQAKIYGNRGQPAIEPLRICGDLFV